MLESPSGSNVITVNISTNPTFYPSDRTTNTKSRYCYTKQSQGLYSLQYEMERPNGTTDWSPKLGTSDILCDDEPTSIKSILTILDC